MIPTRRSSSQSSAPMRLLTPSHQLPLQYFDCPYYTNARHPFIQPSNSYIVASVISSTAIGRGLCFSSAQIGHIILGLHFSGSNYQSHWGPERYEINAVGGMHELGCGGDGGLQGGSDRRNRRLREIEGCIKDPAGKRILEVNLSETSSNYVLILSSLFTQSQAKNGFSEALSLADLWKTIFL